MIFKCPECKRVREYEKMKVVVCPCGTEMEQVDSNHNPLTEEMKICDSHKCENCPIRGVRCFSI